jgi:zinc and cadmium transporter
MPLLAVIMLCAALGGIASAALAVVFLWLPERLATRLLPHFVSFATGALLGAALLGLLPEAMAGAGASGAHMLGLMLVAGLGVFFVIEKLILWWHADHDTAGAPHDHRHAHATHDPGAHQHAHDTLRDRASGVLVLVGDSVHNALDGVLIAAAFLTSRPLGLVTTLAVAAHEIPHRVGDFAVLVHAGFTHRRALVLNLATGLAAVLGAVAAWYGLRRVLGLLPYALAFAAAGFLYIAVAGLIPGLQRRVDPRTSAAQVILIAAGIALIAWVERLAGV